MFEALIAIALGMCVSAAVPTVGKWEHTISFDKNICSLFNAIFTAHCPLLFCLVISEAANAIGPPFMIIGILFAGFYIKIGSLPIVANWVPYFSLFRWTFEVSTTRRDAVLSTLRHTLS